MVKDTAMYHLEDGEVVDFRSPMVYILWDDDECIYVGLSSKGISRPFNPNRNDQVAFDIEWGLCSVTLIPHPDAETLETVLIRLLKPEYNRPSMGSWQYFLTRLTHRANEHNYDEEMRKGREMVRSGVLD